MGEKRYRLTPRELELITAGLLVLVNEVDLGDAMCEEVIGLVERLCMCRSGRPGGSLSREASRLWGRAERRAETKRW
ncbi:MAG: hypothetical protein ABIJ47_14385 [Candidatus Bathyarchaeota archaeon]